MAAAACRRKVAARRDSMNSTRRFFPTSILVVLILAGSAAAQIRTVLVSPVPGDPVASGTALRNALAGISSPSSTNRWLVKIEPGTFDIGATALPMRAWVDIEGSGIGATTIRGNVNGIELNTGAINGASNTELRMLTVTNSVGGPGAQNSIALYNNTVSSMRLYRVKFTSTAGTGSAWGMRNFQSAPLIEECEFSVSASGSAAYGLVYFFIVSSGERSSILRSKIAVSGATNNYGVYMTEAQTLTVLRDSRIDVTGGQFTYGLYATGIWQGNESLAIRDTEISSAGGAQASYGVRFDLGTTVALDIASSKIWGHVAPTTYGISQGGNAPMGLQGASIVGFTKTIESVSNASIASTGLTGGPVSVSGWVGCMGVWDENGVFYAQSCP